MICGRNLNINNNSHYVELNKGQKMSEPHIICSSCYRSNIKVRPERIFCVLCGSTHEISEKVFPRRKNEEPCCRIV